MPKSKFVLIIFFTIFAWPVTVFGQNTESLIAKTMAGDLKNVHVKPSKNLISLAGKPILEAEGVSLDVLKNVKRRIPPFDEVVVLHQVEGTYCNGGRFWFLGLKRDGSYHLSEGIGACFAQEPVVTVGSDFVRVRVRGGVGNHPLPGEPYLPGGTWLYKNGQVLMGR